MKDYIQKHNKTLFLKITLILVFIPIVLISCFAAPQLIIEGYVNDEVNFWMVLPFSILMFLVLFPCAYAIFQTGRLLRYIEQGTFYSEASVRSLNSIRYCGIVATILFGLMLPSVFYFAQMDDAPGLALLGLVFVFGSASIAVFASVVRDLNTKKGEVK